MTTEKIAFAEAKLAHDEIARKYAGAGATSPHFAAYEEAKARLNVAYRALRASGAKA